METCQRKPCQKSFNPETYKQDYYILVDEKGVKHYLCCITCLLEYESISCQMGGLDVGSAWNKKVRG